MGWHTRRAKSAFLESEELPLTGARWTATL